MQGSGERETHLPVKEAYDRWAKAYDGYDNPMVFGAERVLAPVFAAMAGRDVFEFGCGTGRNLAALRAAGARRLAGCDLSPGMLAAAAQRDSGFQLVEQDMAAPVPFPDAAFDLALFSLTLEHVADLNPPLAEAKRLLRAGGVIVIVEIHPFLSSNGIAAHFDDGDQTIYMPTVPHRFADYLNAFAEAGLRITRCREWRPCDFGDDLPAKLLKRGPETPLLVEFELAAQL